MSGFSDIPIENILFEGKQLNIIKDAYPVSVGHCLIITKKIKKTFFDLDIEEKQELLEMIEKAKEIIEKEQELSAHLMRNLAQEVILKENLPGQMATVVSGYLNPFEISEKTKKYGIS